MSNKVTINGNEYSYGEIVEPAFFEDKSKEIVLNGEVVKVGDVWLTRELKEVVITSINIGRWPIKDNKELTYSVYGITDFSFKISDQDLMTKCVKDVKDTEDALRHFNFENAVKMHMDSIVSLIGDRICEKAKSRDVSAVKYLTKVLKKVIALESL